MHEDPTRDGKTDASGAVALQNTITRELQALREQIGQLGEILVGIRRCVAPRSTTSGAFCIEVFPYNNKWRCLVSQAAAMIRTDEFVMSAWFKHRGLTRAEFSTSGYADFPLTEAGKEEALAFLDVLASDLRRPNCFEID